jgi:hypothetical protein
VQTPDQEMIPCDAQAVKQTEQHHLNSVAEHLPRLFPCRTTADGLNNRCSRADRGQ